MICTNLRGPRIVCDVCFVADAGRQIFDTQLESADEAANLARGIAERAQNRLASHNRLATLLDPEVAKVAGARLEKAVAHAVEDLQNAENALGKLILDQEQIPEDVTEALSFFQKSAGFVSKKNPNGTKNPYHVCVTCQKGA